jgi:hypothetical protein
MRLPTLFTSRYFAESVLTGGELVPVRFGVEPPVGEVVYELEETSGAFLVQRASLGEWAWLCSTYRAHLDAVGVEAVADELAEISERRGGKPLALLDHEDMVVRGHRSPRSVFAEWWERNTGQEVRELTEDGRSLHWSQLHKQARPRRHKEPEQDRRWRDAEDRPWPLSRADVNAWVRSRYFQYARTAPKNPHSYTIRGWGPDAMFTKVVLHLREHGEQEVWGGTEYTYYCAAGRKLWTMGDPVPTTVVVNCKFDDPEEQALLAEVQTDRSREELGLEIPRAAGGREEGAAQPMLSDIYAKDHR